MPDIWALMRAIRRSSLAAPEKHVLLTLSTLIDPTTGLIPERFQPSLTELTRATSLGRSTIARALKSVEESGWLKRTVPSKLASQRDKEKTSYLLIIPAAESDKEGSQASATAGLVPQRDQPEGWSQSGTSPRAGLGLVPERDGASARAGHKELNHVHLHEPSPPAEESARDEADNPDALFSVPGQRKPAGDAVAVKPATKGKDRAKRKRLSREIFENPAGLPVDWHVSEEMKAWAKQKAPNVIQSIATERFITYFGDGGKRKKDWDLTWRNWLLGDQQRHMERKSTSNGSGYSSGGSGSNNRKGGYTPWQQPPQDSYDNLDAFKNLGAPR